MGQFFSLAAKLVSTLRIASFDWRWFIPEIYRFKSLLGVTFIVSILTHLLGLAPLYLFRYPLIGSKYGAVGTLYILAAGVVGALIFNGILGFVRDYVINFYLPR